MEPDGKTSKAGRPARRRAVTTMAVVVIIIAGAGLYLTKSILDLPRDVADEGREALREIREIARAFNAGTVTTTFISYAAKVSGSNYLQFATLKQTEVFERTDSRLMLWGQLALPDVVVRSTAPVEYTYYLDLNGHWEMRLEPNRVRVTAPQIQFNTPSIDASAIRYEVREGSVFRDEREVMDELRDSLMALSHQRARENIALIREVGRRKTQEFVENWLFHAYDDGASYRVEIRFADEAVESLENVMNPETRR